MTVVQGFEEEAGFRTKNPAFGRYMSKGRLSYHFPEILGIYILHIFVYVYIYIYVCVKYIYIYI